MLVEPCTRRQTEPYIFTQTEPCICTQTEPCICTQTEPCICRLVEPCICRLVEPYICTQTEPCICSQTEPCICTQITSLFYVRVWHFQQEDYHGHIWCMRTVIVVDPIPLHINQGMRHTYISLCPTKLQCVSGARAANK
jgi:hypothetical protein